LGGEKWWSKWKNCAQEWGPEIKRAPKKKKGFFEATGEKTRPPLQGKKLRTTPLTTPKRYVERHVTSTKRGLKKELSPAGATAGTGAKEQRERPVVGKKTCHVKFGETKPASHGSTDLGRTAMWV